MHERYAFGTHINHDNTYQWFRPRVKKLEDDPAYDSTDWVAAMEKSLDAAWM